ncbi:MAG TPA: glycoside hydrolase family 38 C-terminal domain-containing protein [Solirubrobacter sp.]|nr:glycoside hydrolase family 38 C-terminal domain-containing protein [Solirubrobacter sp.]
MALSLEQRLDWLDARIGELECWVVRSWVPLDEWRFDGEPIGVGEPWPRRDGVRTLTHPRVEGRGRLQLELGGEGLLRVVYDDRVDAFGLDTEHHEFPLRGGPFALAVEIVARLEFGKPNRDARLALARVVEVDEPLERLVRRLRLVHEAGVELGEDIGLVDCAAAALAELRWPSATWPFVSRQAGSELLQNVWELPDGLDPHPPPLDEAARASVDAALDTLAARLAELGERHPPAGALLLTGHAHLDLAWRWPLEETRRKARRTLSTAVGLLDRHPEFHFNQSTAQVFAFLEEDDPALLERIAEHVRDGRFEPIGGMWVEPDCNMPAGESLVRQLLYGQRWFEQRFGAPHTVCWLPDCFGFTPALPQLLAGAGITHFLTIKLSWSETNPFPHDLFRWEGLDGTRVLAHMFDNPEWGYNGHVGPRDALGTWSAFRGKRAFGESLLSVGYGDGGGGPTEDMVQRARDLDGFPGLPRQRFGRVDEFFRRAEAGAGPLPVWSGELYLELHRGTLTTQGRVKRLHRRAERDLVAAEALGALVALAGGELPGSLEPLWRVLLRNEFHDILPGSSIREVYETAETELASVRAGAREASERALDALVARLDGEGEGVLVVNPDLSARPVRLELDGAPLTAPGAIEALEARVVTPQPAGALSVADDTLENDLVRVEVATDGTLASVYDKRAGREVLDGPGNQLWVYVDAPREWDAWDLEANYAQDGEPLPCAVPPRVVEDGPHRVAVRVERAFRDSRVVQDIRLWAGSPRIDFHTRIEWHDRRRLLKARFPLAVRSPRATFETAFGVVERPTHRNTSWDEARFEVPGHRFADLSEPGYGAALLNDGRYGHHALGSELGLSLLRSPIWPDPLADEGEQELVYALLPHAGGWHEGGVLMEAEDLNRPLFARRARGAGSLRPLRVGGMPAALGALKALEDGGGLLLRVYEPQGARGVLTIELPDGWALARELDLLERDAGPPRLGLGPFAVKSWGVVSGSREWTAPRPARASGPAPRPAT